jgi:hypothetical protein
MMYQGSLAGLTVGGDVVRVLIDEIDKAQEAATALGWHAERDGDALLVHGVAASEVNRALAMRRLYAHGIATESRKLEDVFLELTEGEGADAPANDA